MGKPLGMRLGFRVRHKVRDLGYMDQVVIGRTTASGMTEGVPWQTYNGLVNDSATRTLREVMLRELELRLTL